MNKEIQFILYQLPDEEGRVQVVIKDETIWATQKAMAQLFGVGVPAISKHLAHIFEEGELDKDMVVAKFATTTQHGAIEGKTQSHMVDFYNLDMIISVGYRVSYRGVQFRMWATKVLKEYIVKGFALNDDLLKRAGGGNYFDFLRISRKDILTHAGRISAQLAKAKADSEYDKFKERTKNELTAIEIHFIEQYHSQPRPLLLYSTGHLQAQSHYSNS